MKKIETFIMGFIIVSGQILWGLFINLPVVMAFGFYFYRSRKNGNSILSALFSGFLAYGITLIIVGPLVHFYMS